METVRDFIFCSKITADGGCSHEIKTLAPWKKSYNQPRQHIKKQRNYLTEAEDIKKRWQEYTEELYKKDLHDPDNHGM